jgi:hypothetical protein
MSVMSGTIICFAIGHTMHLARVLILNGKIWGFSYSIFFKALGAKSLFRPHYANINFIQYIYNIKNK